MDRDTDSSGNFKTAFCVYILDKLRPMTPKALIYIDVQVCDVSAGEPRGLECLDHRCEGLISAVERVHYDRLLSGMRQREPVGIKIRIKYMFRRNTYGAWV